jgi:hypothetical protein
MQSYGKKKLKAVLLTLKPKYAPLRRRGTFALLKRAAKGGWHLAAWDLHRPWFQDLFINILVLIFPVSALLSQV